MQTFLPYPSFDASAAALDNKRLWKQCVEVKQILKACVHGGGWAAHPAVRMWKGYEASLMLYGIAMCCEASKRGINAAKLWNEFIAVLYLKEKGAPEHPPWLGNEAFHASHRSNLLRKDPEYYGGWGWEEPHDLPYVWPYGGKRNEVAYED
jgi:hypothetical protein